MQCSDVRGRTSRRSLLRALGWGSAAALLTLVPRRRVAADEPASSASETKVTRVCGYYNATGDWLAWIQVLNENDEAQDVTLEVYNLAGTLLYESTSSLNPHQTVVVPLEMLSEVKGKQGLVVLASEPGKRIAAFLISRKASQPDYTSAVVALPATSIAA